MSPSLSDRIVSVLAYFTFGIFSIIWIVYANIVKKPISSFLGFNLYQGIFISVVFAVISLIYSIAINLLSLIPFIGKIALGFDIFFNQTPLYFTFTISGLIVTLIVTYLSVMSLLGKKPYIPIVSDVVRTGFGG